MTWLKKLLKEEEGYGVVEMLFLIAGFSALAFSVSSKLLGALRPVHLKAVENIKGVTRSGH